MGERVPARMLEKAVIRFELDRAARAREDRPPPARVITISRQLGSGGRRLSEILAERTGWALWDREILDVLADQSAFRYQSRMFESLDERSQSEIDALAYSLLGGVTKHLYHHLLPRAILIIAQNDAIILGRAAHLLLAEAFKVSVVAPLDVRVRNLALREGLTEEEARERIRVFDQERCLFYKELAARLGQRYRDPKEMDQYDMIVNSQRVRLETAATMILKAAEWRFDR